MINHLGSYIVWNPASGQPHMLHPTKLKAEKEAERLTQLQPKDVFYVCQLVSLARTISPVTIERYRA